jgi:hypothetical protein
MSGQAIDEARKALEKLDLFGGAQAADVEIARLGGLTNLVERV